MSTIVIVIGAAIVIEHWVNTHRSQAPAFNNFAVCIVAAPQLSAKKMLPLDPVPLDTPSILYEMAKHEGALIELPIGISKPSLAFQADHRVQPLGGWVKNRPYIFSSSAP